MTDRLLIRDAAPLMGYSEGGLRRACAAGRIDGARLEIRVGRAVWTIPAATANAYDNPGKGRPSEGATMDLHYASSVYRTPRDLAYQLVYDWLSAGGLNNMVETLDEQTDAELVDEMFANEWTHEAVDRELALEVMTDIRAEVGTRSDEDEDE